MYRVMPTMRCSTWMYAWVVWTLGNAADKGFDNAPAVRDWAAGKRCVAPAGTRFRRRHDVLGIRP
jgi:hypothetical protein